MAKYLICGIVVFDDDLYEMSRNDDLENVVQLGATASRCLRVLLEAEGQIVTKSDLLYKGWEQYRNIVTGNSLNQAVAQIRKGLSSLSMNPQGIVTIPRIGYKLADDFFVEKIEGRNPAAAAPEPHPPASEAAAQPDVPATPEASPDSTAEIRPGARTRTWLLPISVVLNLALALGAWFFLSADPLKDAAQIRYVPVRPNGAVNYFAVKDVTGGSAHVESSIAMLERYPPASASTESSRYVYINGALRENVHSYFLCQNPIETPNGRCVSYLILSEGGRK